MGMGGSRRFSFGGFGITHLEYVLLNSFANKGRRCLIFVKGLTLSKCTPNSSLNLLVLLIRVGYYLGCCP